MAKRKFAVLYFPLSLSEARLGSPYSCFPLARHQAPDRQEEAGRLRAGAPEHPDQELSMVGLGLELSAVLE